MISIFAIELPQYILSITIIADPMSGEGELPAHVNRGTRPADKWLGSSLLNFGFVRSSSPIILHSTPPPRPPRQHDSSRNSTTSAHLLYSLHHRVECYILQYTQAVSRASFVTSRRFRLTFPSLAVATLDAHFPST